MNDTRIRINKKMVAWSNGERTNLIPSVRREVCNYGNMMGQFLSNLEDGSEVNYGECYVARQEGRIHEYEADQLWENGYHLEALNEMIDAAMYVLPDDEPLFEDVQWLNPDETLYWHPNLKEFRRLMRRCRELCKREPRLWPILESNWLYRDYCRYLKALGRWARPAPTGQEVYRNCW